MLELSPELVGAISAFVGFVVAEGLQSLSRVVKRDLSGLATALTAAFVSVLVASVNGLLGLIPPQYTPFVRGLLAFLVIVLGPVGIHSILKKAR